MTLLFIRIASRLLEDSTIHKPTKLLYLAPIFMGLLGGILMYIAVKDQNQEMANDGMFWSVLSQIGWSFLIGLLWFLGMANLNNFV